jgi:hypothetical protein
LYCYPKVLFYIVLHVLIDSSPVIYVLIAVQLLYKLAWNLIFGDHRELRDSVIFICLSHIIVLNVRMKGHRHCSMLSLPSRVNLMVILSPCSLSLYYLRLLSFPYCKLQSN